MSTWTPTLLRDRPVDLGESRDDFGHAAYARVLVDVLKSEQEPMTIGLLGPWGVGKSSVLERVRTDLGEDVATVMFNAWRYDGDTLRRQIVRDTAHQLKKEGRLRYRLWDGRPRFNLKRRLPQLDYDEQVTADRLASPGGVRLAYALLQALLLGGLIVGALQLHQLRDSFDGLGTKSVALTLGLTILTFVAALFGQALRPPPTVRTRRRMEDPDRLHELFREIVAATKPARLVIMVDNLDRCPAADAIALLGMIKTYLEPAAESVEGTQVQFVLALDEASLRRHLTSVGDSGANADEYLRKIFSAVVRFSPLHDADRRTYIEKKIVEMDPEGAVLDDDDRREIADMVDAAFRSNPRQVIQFLNTLQLRVSLFEGERRKPQIITRLAVIENRWPDSYAQLLPDPTLLARWESVAEPGNPDQPAGEEWKELGPFVNLTRHIEKGDLSAYLIGVRRGATATDLPEAAAFETALVDGRREEVRAIVDRHPERKAAYSEQAARTFHNELPRGGSRPRAVLDVVLTERLGEPLTLLREALDGSGLDDQLPFLSLEPLLGMLADLEGAARAKALDAIATRLVDADSPERSHAAAEGLARASTELTPEDIGVVRRLISAELRVADLTPLVVALPALVDDELTAGLTRRMNTDLNVLDDPEAPALLEAVLTTQVKDEIHDGFAQGVADIARVREGGLPSACVDRVLAVAENGDSVPVSLLVALAETLRGLPATERRRSFDRLWESSPLVGPTTSSPGWPRPRARTRPWATTTAGGSA